MRQEHKPISNKIKHAAQAICAGGVVAAALAVWQYNKPEEILCGLAHEPVTRTGTDGYENRYEIKTDCGTFGDSNTLWHLKIDADTIAEVARDSADRTMIVRYYGWDLPGLGMERNILKISPIPLPRNDTWRAANELQ